MAHLAIGSVAPDFTLRDETGVHIHLREQLARGPIVLIFYPADRTPGCTAQLCAARDDRALYAAAGVRAFGVNNGSMQSHQQFSAKHKFATPLLVDTGLAVAKQYHAAIVLGPLRIIRRTVVGIGSDGTIVFYRRGMPETAEILAAFKR